MKVVLASHNAGKIKELSTLLKSLHIELIPQADLNVPDIEETGTTFVENALLKARHASQQTGLPALADDSGLVVPILQGAPGIYSARYAGEKASADDNMQKLLTELEKVEASNRQAYFYCVLVFMQHFNDPAPLISDGKWYGSILFSKIGTQGFGYDPLFYVPSEKKSAAELPLEIKNNISHRGQALQSLVKLLAEKI